MQVTVIHPSGDPDQFNSNMGGPMLGHKLVCRDANGDTVYVEVNTKGQDQKSANAYPPGRTFEFLPNGRTFDGQAFWYDEANGWTPYADTQGVPLRVSWQKGKREDQAQGGGRNMSPAGNPYNGGGQRPSANAQPQRPQAPHGAANAPQQHSREVPTVGQRLGLIHSLFPRCYKMAVAAVAGTDEPPGRLAVSSTMNIVISLDRGEIQQDPSAAQIEAAAKAKAVEAQRLAEEAERAKQAAEAARVAQQGPPAYDPADPAPIDDDSIPF